MTKVNWFVAALAAVASCTFGVNMTAADTITHIALPGDVPDEAPPRVNVGDAPDGFGPDSWQGPETGKSNYHVRYDADGDVLSLLFPDEAATLTIGDIASISYLTKRPDGTNSSRDWWIQIYTRPTGDGDASSWYHARFINNYQEHTETDVWTEYSTDAQIAPMTFRNQAGGDPLNFADFKAEFGDQLVEMISVQTDSGWDGFNGYIDGLTITLENSNVGRINFEGVPEPSSLALASLSLAGLGYVVRRKRRRA